MPKPIIRRVSPARKSEDGNFHLTGHWKDRPMPIFAGERVGVAIALERAEGESDDPVRLTIQRFKLDQTPIGNGVNVTFRPGQGAVYDFELVFTSPPEMQAGYVQVWETANADNTAEQLVEAYPGKWGLWGDAVFSRSADEAILSKWAAQVPHPLCADHLAYLRSTNGTDYTWWKAPEWSRSDAFFEALGVLDAQEGDTHLSERCEPPFWAERASLLWVS